MTGGAAPPGGSPRYNSGRPFDAVTNRVRWANNLGTMSLAPVGSGQGVVHVVAQDSVLYSFVKGTTGGSWPGPLSPSNPPFPLQWTPFGFMAAPAQGRPSTYPAAIGPANSVVFLSSQDGQVYAIDAEEGGNGAGPWTSPLLGSTVIGHVSGMFGIFGGTTNAIVVGSRETPPTTSRFYALRLNDGAASPLPGWSQDFGGRMGPIFGQAAVDYETSRVYFASRQYGAGAGDNNTLWCLELLTGAVVWARPYGDIDASISLRGNRLYIATNNPRTVQAIDKLTGNATWTVSGAFPITPAGEGPAKGFVFARVGSTVNSTDLYFATANRIWKLTDDGGPSYIDNWPGGIAVNSPSTPISLPGDVYVYVGSGDGSLHRHDTTTGALVDFFPLGDQSPALRSKVGSPTFDIRNNFIYVPADAGLVYAIERP